MLEQCIFTISPVLGHFEAHLCCILWIYPYKESVRATASQSLFKI